MLGIEDAEHEETAPNAASLLISKLTCSLAGETQTIRMTSGSLVRQAYGRGEAAERFACNYGFNPEFRDKIEKGRLKITGVDPGGNVRVVELSGTEGRER